MLSLIGYRGTGKTTVARLLALRLGWDWADADVEIELRAGKSIASIFADDGEPAFRDLESAVIADLCSHHAPRDVPRDSSRGARLLPSRGIGFQPVDDPCTQRQAGSLSHVNQLVLACG